MKQITFKVTMQLDEEWASHLTKEELQEYIETRINSSMGFRGRLKRFTILGRRDGKHPSRRQN